MAQLYSTGPVAIFTQLSYQPTPVFLGTGAQAPEIHEDAQYTGVKNDLAGGVDFDKVYAGSTARVSVTANYVNFNTLNAIRNRAQSGLFLAPLPGFDLPGQRGSLMLTESAAHVLYLVFLGSGKPFYTGAVNGVMPPGYRFLGAMLDPETFTGGAAKEAQSHLSWTCLSAFSPLVTNAYGVGGFALYDYIVTAAASVPMV